MSRQMSKRGFDGLVKGDHMWIPNKRFIRMTKVSFGLLNTISISTNLYNYVLLPRYPLKYGF